MPLTKSPSIQAEATETELNLLRRGDVGMSSTLNVLIPVIWLHRERLIAKSTGKGSLQLPNLVDVLSMYQLDVARSLQVPLVFCSPADTSLRRSVASFSFTYS